MNYLACSFLHKTQLRDNARMGLLHGSFPPQLQAPAAWWIPQKPLLLVAVLLQRDRTERSQLLHNPSPAMQWCLGPFQEPLHGVKSRRQAAGCLRCMWDTDNHSITAEGTKIALRKKSQVYCLQWNLRDKKRMVLLSLLLPYLGRKKSCTFSGIPMVPTKSDSAATHLSSTQ